MQASVASSFIPPLSPTSFAVVAAGAVLVCTFVVHRQWKASQLRNIPRPPETSFIFGHLFDIWTNIATWNVGGHYPEPFLSWTKKYGGALWLREFTIYSVLFTDPVALQHMLIANGTNYPRLPIARGYVRDVTLGDGLFSVEGKEHDTFRKLTNPLFAVSKIKTLVEIFNHQAELYSQKYLEPACDTNTPVDLAKMFTRLTLSIVGLTVLGYDFDKSPVALEAYEQSMIEVNPLMLIGTFAIPGFLNLPIPSLMKRRRAQATLKKILVDIIHEKLATAASEMPNDLLDMILPHATTDEAVSHTMTFMLAGHDTSSNTLGFVFGTLPSYPDVITAIRAEYNGVISKYGSLNSWEAVSELKYTQAAIQETLRLNTVVFSTIQRIALDDDLVPMSDGSTVFMPKGTSMYTNMAVMHLNPKYWKDPEVFIPDRFVEGTPEWDADLALRAGKSHAFYYMPFSAGAKSCIGQRFAMAEMQMIVATLFSKYEFTPTSKTDMRLGFSAITLKPGNVEMTVRRVAARCA